MNKLALSEAPHAYDILNRKQDGCVKVVLHPGQTVAASAEAAQL